MTGRNALVGAALIAAALVPGSQKAGAQQIPHDSEEQSSRPPVAVQEIPLPSLDRRALSSLYPPEISEPQSPFRLEGITLHFDRDHFKNRVKEYEGELLHPYPDKVGIITIGCGFNMEKHAVDHPNDPHTYNSMQRVDPSGEEVWRRAAVTTALASQEKCSAPALSAIREARRLQKVRRPPGFSVLSWAPAQEFQLFL